MEFLLKNMQKNFRYRVSDNTVLYEEHMRAETSGHILKLFILQLFSIKLYCSLFLERNSGNCSLLGLAVL